jgi:hypothetical protein
VLGPPLRHDGTARHENAVVPDRAGPLRAGPFRAHAVLGPGDPFRILYPAATLGLVLAHAACCCAESNHLPGCLLGLVSSRPSLPPGLPAAHWRLLLLACTCGTVHVNAIAETLR